MSGGFFSLRTPEDLYAKARRDSQAFHYEPSPDGLFNLVCTLSHLRDWICPGRGKSYEGRDPASWSRAEQLHNDLGNDLDYQIVRDLCNNAKHFSDAKGIGADSGVTHGLFLDHNFFGDYFGHPNYHARGRGLREVIASVFSKYEAYFGSNV